jgi:rod shape-determining protein MreC
VLSLLLVVSLTIVVLNLKGGGEDARSGAAGIFGPIENAAAAIVRPVSEFISSIGSLGSKDEQIRSLQQQNQALQQQLDASEYQRKRAQQLDDLLRVAGLGRYRTVPAQVVATGPAQGFGRTVTIDAGTLDGVEVDQSVINGQGLVGKVVAVAGTTAVVQLISDSESTVGARLENTGRVGLLSGSGDDQALTLSLLDQISAVEVGERLVTRGSVGGRPYVAGVPLGVVTALGGMPGGGGRVATVRPFVDLSALDVVGVVVEPPRTDPRDAVLPPAPTVSTTPSGSTSTPGSGS